MKNKISIITPIYNSEKTIEKCVKSQINQTYDNIEIILVDDGSKDNSGDICDKYCNMDNRIQVIHKKNEGVAEARNVGLSKATGKWILFVDSDDYLENNACENLIKITGLDDDIDIIIGTSNLVKNGYKVKNTVAKHNYSGIINEDDKKNLIKNIFVNKNEEFSYVGTPWAKLYNAEFLKKNEVKFKRGLQLGEDMNFNFEAFFKASKIYFYKEPIYNYAIDVNSISNKFLKDMIEQFDLMFKEFEKKSFINEYKNEYYYLVMRQLKKLEKNYFFNQNNKESEKIKKKKYIELISRHPYDKAIDCKENLKNEKITKRFYVILLKLKCYEVIKIWNNKRGRK